LVVITTRQALQTVGKEWAFKNIQIFGQSNPMSIHIGKNVLSTKAGVNYTL
jgi:hypothetical protein